MQLHLIMSPEVMKAIDQGKDIAVVKFGLTNLIIVVILLAFIWRIVLPFLTNLFIKTLTARLEKELEFHKTLSDTNMKAIMSVLEHNRTIAIESIRMDKEKH